MDPISDPEALRDEAGVEFREQERVVDDDDFETAVEGAESQSGMVVVGVTNDDGALLLVDSRWVDGWTLPNGPVGVDEDWAVLADRWSEDQLGFPVQIGEPELVIRTETRAESSEDSVVGYTVAFRASMFPGVAGGGPGPAGGPPPGVGPGEGGPPEGAEGTPPSGGGPPEGAGPGGAGVPGGPAGGPVADRSDLDWFADVPDDVAPGHDALVEFFLD